MYPRIRAAYRRPMLKVLELVAARPAQELRQVTGLAKIIAIDIGLTTKARAQVRASCSSQSRRPAVNYSLTTLLQV
jgi:hypothetical protein